MRALVAFVAPAAAFNAAGGLAGRCDAMRTDMVTMQTIFNPELMYGGPDRRDFPRPPGGMRNARNAEARRFERFGGMPNGGYGMDGFGPQPGPPRGRPRTQEGPPFYNEGPLFNEGMPPRGRPRSSPVYSPVAAVTSMPPPLRQKDAAARAEYREQAWRSPMGPAQGRQMQRGSPYEQAWPPPYGQFPDGNGVPPQDPRRPTSRRNTRLYDNGAVPNPQGNFNMAGFDNGVIPTNPNVRPPQQAGNVPIPNVGPPPQAGNAPGPNNVRPPQQVGNMPGPSNVRPPQQAGNMPGPNNVRPPQQGMGGPPQGMGAPPQGMGAPPQGMGAPPQGMGNGFPRPAGPPPYGNQQGGVAPLAVPAGQVGSPTARAVAA